METSAGQNIDATKCPLCGQPNDCQLCTAASYKGPCWCAKMKFPEELLAKVPPELRNRACICLACVMQFNRERKNGSASQKVLPGDFYFENGLMVFTAAYHLRRGFCCESGCRHCPYPSHSTVRTFPSASQ
ncbi:MAG TPA: cysteine-rich CWC family protein [Verrucomicrobiae bacterium]|jgi:hypothetical protein|nr:cysteine-rich CWC family protein [Verrucomicrobiae bacterium]